MRQGIHICSAVATAKGSLAELLEPLALRQLSLIAQVPCPPLVTPNPRIPVLAALKCWAFPNAGWAQK